MSSKNDDFFGGLFDFNGDGKTTWGEKFLAYKIFEETTKEECDDIDNDDNDYEIEDDFIPTYHATPKSAPVVAPSSVPQPKASTPEPLSKENYPQRKKALESSIHASIRTGLLLSPIPIVVMGATIDSFDAYNSSDVFASILFFGVGLVVLGIIWVCAICSISQNWKDLHILKENYQKLLPEDEQSAIHKKKHKGRIITSCIIGVVIAGLITLWAVNFAKLANTYDKAVTFVDRSSYKEAIELFEEIKEKKYRDTAAYILLCEAHSDYDRGDISSAYYDMKSAHFSHLSSKQEKSVNDFAAILKDEYDVYLKEKSEADAKAYRDRITYGVPYVGMLESEIMNTSLGAPSSNVRHNRAGINGEQYWANIYDFKSGNKTIFTARCVQGRVTEVWDDRNTTTVPYIPKKSTTQKADDDPYDVNDYSNEEDFYYDHYDDFFDYYDAEDYYNEHHK